MEVLFDADLLVYESSYAAGTTDDGSVRSFDWVIDYLDKRIDYILDACGEEKYRLFITGKGNFRYDIATVKPYKATRGKDKPFHYDNVRAYLSALPECSVVDGMEADDMLAIEATKYIDNGHGDDVLIASRDKDLRQVPVWQYSWEVHQQPEWGPLLVDPIGELQFKWKKKVNKLGEESEYVSKVSGTGIKWFYAQCIIGDTTDNIPGLEGKGNSFVHQFLEECETEKDMFDCVLAAYEAKYGDAGKERLLEQGRLLWMCRHQHEDGSPVMWELL